MRFDDGTAGEVDLSDSAKTGGISSAWSDAHYWRSADIVPDTGAVAWGDGEVDACPLSLYLERTVVCWGPSSEERDPRWGDPLGPAKVPSGTFAMLTAAQWHSCGLRDDRRVECWGDLANVLWTPFEIGELRLTRTSTS